MRHLDRQGVLFGSADPNPGVDLANSFWVLMLDQSQDITGLQSGRSGTTRTRTMDVGVSITAGEYWDYEGKHVTITVPAIAGWYPSDTSLPLGMLRVYDVRDIRLS